MVQPTEINIKGKVYYLALPDFETDYIQQKIVTEKKPYEAAMLADMAVRLPQESCYIDIGSNVGNHALYMACVADCAVFAFEPNQHLVNAIKQSIKLNKKQKAVKVFNIGLGAEASVADFSEQKPDNLGAQSLTLGLGAIKVERLDDQNIKLPVGIIKIDVEGMELAVLKGAIETIKHNRPFLYVECQSNDDFNEVSAFLTELNYSYWDTFNATPTHLFIPSEKLTVEDRLSRLQISQVRELYAVQTKLNDVNKKLNDANQKYRQATSDITTLKTKLDDANQKYRLSNEQLSQRKEEVAKLTEQLSDVNAKQQHTATELANNKVELTTAREKYRLVNSTISDLKAKFEQQKSELSAAQSQRLQLLAENEQQTRAVKALQLNIASQQDSLEQLENALSEQQTTAHQLEQTINVLQQKLTDLEVQNQQLEQRNNQLEQAYQQQLAANLQQQELLNELEQIKGRSVLLSPLYQELKQQQQELQAQTAQLQQQKLALSEELSAQTTQNKQWEYKALTAQKKLKEHQQQLTQAQAQQQQLQLQHIADRSELDILKALAKPAAKQYSPDPLLPAPLLPVAQWQTAQTQRAANLKALKVACIMDEFTFGSYAPEANLLQLTPQYWQNELEAFVPQLLFIESAWRGKHEIWGNKVGHKCQELVDIISWCKQRNIPTVFWNKEDPVHFETFISTAQLFDQVYTTDIDCIHRYKKALGHNKVFLLPFAAQPTVNNPIEKYPRKKAFCFAGAYYVRYPDRTRDLESFIKALPAYQPLEIYDRNFGKDDENYQFPQEYQPFIVGNLPYEQIDKAYKGYDYAINLNSIKHSQTMFARRVYELLASNTLTVSNYARGIKLLFGDLVACSDSGEQIVDWLKQTEATEHSAQSLRLLALRAVMQYHTYQDRLAYIANKAGLLDSAAILPPVTIFAYASNQQRYNTLVSQFSQQRYDNKRLVLAMGTEVTERSTREDIVSIDLADLTKLNASELASSAGWVGFMVAEDYYGPDYLTDMALATRYAPGTVVGKGCHYKIDANGELGVNYPGRRYQLGGELEARYALIKASELDNADLYLHLRSIYKLKFNISNSLAIDAYSYCKGAALTATSELLTALSTQYQRQPAADYLALQQFAEGITAPGEHALLSITPDQLKQQLAAGLSEQTKLNAELTNAGLQLTGRLAKDKHTYVYLAQTQPVVSLMAQATDCSKVAFSLAAKPNGSLDCRMVLQWLAADNSLISQSFTATNSQNISEVPAGAVTMRLGLRLAGCGSQVITAINLKALSVEGSETLPAIEALQLKRLLSQPKNSQVKLTEANQVVEVYSALADGKHEYYYAVKPIPLSELPITADNQLHFHLETTPGLNLQLFVGFVDAQQQKISHDIRYANKNHTLAIPEGTASVQLALRFYAGGACTIKRLIWGHLTQQPQTLLPQSDVLLLTNHYPSYQDLYRNGFVHSRVKAYREQGVKVDIFRFRPDEPVSWHEYQGIEVITASQHALRQMLASGAYRHVLVHFLAPEMWEVLKDFIDTIKVTVWVHGAEIHPWHRRKYNIQTPEQETAAIAASDIRMAFWHSVLNPMPLNLKLIFVSKYFAEEVMEDLGYRLPETQYQVIHNPINTELFNYIPKPAEQRKKILSIRPFASRQYANDLTVAAIVELSKERFFNELEFRIIGDGPLYEETVAPITVFNNVTLEKRFVSQPEIAALHKEYGIFLCPTRWDSQGVSRDEAMSSGLVIVTNNVAAVSEFVTHDVGILCKSESFRDISEAITNIYNSEETFQNYSISAKNHIRKKLCMSNTILNEMNVINE